MQLKTSKKDKNIFLGHARLAEARELMGLTQQEAATKYGVSRVTWGQWERGANAPSADALAGLAQDGADVLYILTGKRQENLSSTFDGEVSKAPACSADTVEVPLYDVELSAGHGTSIHDEEVIDTYTFKRSFIQETGCRPDRLAMAIVRGDSMEPTLEGGDYVLLDTRVNRFYADGIYAIRYDDSLMIKRLAKQLDGSIEIISDNKKRYDKMVVTDDMRDKFAIVGYLVNFSRGNKTCYTPSKDDSG